VSLIAADRGMADVLAAVPDETAVPLKEIGHATDVDAEDLAEAAEWFYSHLLVRRSQPLYPAAA
jgi:hypothetical protein